MPRAAPGSVRWLLLGNLLACSCSPSLFELEHEEPAFYRYEGEDGRPAFVSDPSFAPPGVTVEPFDVSQVELNEDLAGDLTAALRAEHERLVRTPYCRQQRARAGRSLWQHMYEEQPQWLAIAGTVLLLLPTAPTMARRVGAPKWLRLLALVIPLLLFLGTLTHALRTAQQTLAEAKDARPLCDEDALSDADPSEGATLVHQLQRRVRQAHGGREARLQEVIESAR